MTFIVTNGMSMVGNPVTMSVNSSGTASTSILLPAGTLGGTDTIVAIYNGNGELPRLDRFQPHHHGQPGDHDVHRREASETFSTVGAQTVNLSATVSSTSSNGAISEGTETFTILVA